MSATLAGVLLIVLSSAIEGFAQVCLKQSASASNRKYRWILLGVLLFICEAVSYTGALQRLDVSTAYPMGALSFVSVTLFSRWILNESVDSRRWSGLILVIFGAILIAA
jgi:drug/metabolite transporter (DMT)-like permease